MYLYEISDDKLIVHQFLEDKEKMSEYKRKEIEKIPYNERIYTALTDEDKVLESNKQLLNHYDVNYNNKNKDINNSFHTLYKKEFNKKDYMQIIDNYINSLKQYRTYIVKAYKDMETGCYVDRKYFIPLDNYYKIDDEFLRYLKMDNVLKVTKNLYLLQNFINEKYDILTEDEILKILELFNLKDNYIFSEYSIEKLIKCNLINEENFNNKLKNSEKILNLIK